MLLIVIGTLGVDAVTGQDELKRLTAAADAAVAQARSWVHGEDEKGSRLLSIDRKGTLTSMTESTRRFDV